MADNSMGYRMLMAAVLKQAILYDDDVEWLALHPMAKLYMNCLFGPDMAFRVVQAVLRAPVARGPFNGRVYDMERGGYRRPEDPVVWQNWGGGLALREGRR